MRTGPPDVDRTTKPESLKALNAGMGWGGECRGQGSRVRCTHGTVLAGMSAFKTLYHMLIIIMLGARRTCMDPLPHVGHHVRAHMHAWTLYHMLITCAYACMDPLPHVDHHVHMHA